MRFLPMVEMTLGSVISNGTKRREKSVYQDENSPVDKNDINEVISNEMKGEIPTKRKKKFFPLIEMTHKTLKYYK